MVIQDDARQRAQDKHCTDQHPSPKDDVGNSKYQCEDGHQHIELNLNLERPSNRIHGAANVVDDVVLVDHRREEMGSQIRRHKTSVGDKQGEKHQQIDNVRRLQTGHTSEEIRLQMDGGAFSKGGSGKGYRQDETADCKEQLYTEAALAQNGLNEGT